MPRVAGVDIPNDKKVWVSLTYIYGIGPKVSKDICEALGLDADARAKDLTDDEVARIAAHIQDQLVAEGALRRQIQQNVNRLKEIMCYRGLRHRRQLPVRGQRTRCNARTRKGKKKTMANKKILRK